MTMTKEDWDYVERGCSHPYGHVQLMCDGFTLGLKVESVGTLKYAIVPFVNGYFKGQWLFEDCEERRRFYRPSTRPILNRKQQEQEKKIARLAKRPSRHKETFTAWLPYWPSFGPLRRHLIRNNTDITLVRGDA
ncbi:hypothetical protein G3N56_19530 [Desulfovibrio sulfodismutans]|uniref:Uncharacterized protein n=1 Tax=Desulfolutivibrio sulfodismutans TaxID=63561 RepID=A0A7K3NSZ7_9BACT|nr:hypothetical protein [Desulfolutivibrio sulfodismutans]NDY58933.1 hypothetical protein [Desulfolutivibrio sulfodismutans]QLA13566.1 hypothetical protein GD606_15475 [Desulfolutivibrio sulfodismutans DSM 3696]